MNSRHYNRRQFLAGGATAAAGLAALNPSEPTAAAAASSEPAPHAERPGDKLRVATCQFPVTDNCAANAEHIRDFMRRGADAGAHLVHTSEACLSGYAGIDVPTFYGFDWRGLRKGTESLRELARDLKVWLVLGSAHFLDDQTKPTNCLYLVDPQGAVADRYDKSMLTGSDKKHYSAGNRLVVREIQGVTLGLAICYDICWPQVYMAYRERGASLMIHSFYNAGSIGENCLDVLNTRQVTTRCADNRMWAVANNSSRPYSHWASFIARPDATIAQQLEINTPGMLVHDFPDGLSKGGWYHNFQPMKLREDEMMTWGTPSTHPRQLDWQSEP